LADGLGVADCEGVPGGAAVPLGAGAAPEAEGEAEVGLADGVAHSSAGDVVPVKSRFLTIRWAS
jgi:hypothetical protein